MISENIISTSIQYNLNHKKPSSSRAPTASGYAAKSSPRLVPTASGYAPQIPQSSRRPKISSVTSINFDCGSANPDESGTTTISTFY
jgi:hypothetical protein